MRRVAVLCVLAAIMFAGCERTEEAKVHRGTYSESISTFWVTAIDGRRIPCVGLADKGISCDWSLK